MSCHGVHVPAGYLAMTAAYARCTSRCCWRSPRSSFHAGISSSRDQPNAVCVVATTALAAVLLAAAVQLQAARERAYPPADATEDALALSSASAVRRLTGAYNNAVSPTLLDPRHSVLWRHQAEGRRGGRASGNPGGIHRHRSPRTPSPCCTAAGHHHDARSAVQHRLPHSGRCSWPSVPAGRGSARSGGRAAGKGAARAAGQMAVSAGHRLCLLLVSPGLSHRPPRGSRKRPTCRARLRGFARWRRRPWRRAAIRASSRAMWTAILQTAETDWLRKGSGAPT